MVNPIRPIATLGGCRYTSPSATVGTAPTASTAGLADAVARGLLRPGEPLPPSRTLAVDLGVSRNTVTAAYDRLMAEGLIVARVGSGTFVAPRVAARGTRRRRPSALRARSSWAAPVDPIGPPRAAVAFDFAIGVPDARLFPRDDWRRGYTDALRQVTAHEFHYRDPMGEERLRAAIARHIGLSRAVEATATDVVVTAGAQQALALVATVMLKPGDVVAVEEPGYPPVRELLRAMGIVVRAVPVDDEGIVVSALPPRAALVYTTPSHQFPLGMAMSYQRRLALLQWADEHQAGILEDDYDSEFGFGQRPLDALHSLDRSGRVIYIGTFSKSLSPMLRMGFVVAPPSLRPALENAKRLGDWHSDTMTQLALAALIDNGHFATHLRRARRAYRRRQALIRDVLARDFGGLLDPLPAAAGLHVAARLSPESPQSAEKIVEIGARRGVRLQSIERFYARAPLRGGLVLGLGAVDEAAIMAGLSRLREDLR